MSKDQARNAAKRTLSCAKCGLVVSKASRGGFMRSLHDPGQRSDHCDGEVVEFDSKLEAQQWQTLLAAWRSGRLTGLQRQVRFPIHVASGHRVGHYIADFVIEDAEQGWRVIDAKGVRYKRTATGHKRITVDTSLARFKRRAVELEYGLTIELWSEERGHL